MASHLQPFFIGLSNMTSSPNGKGPAKQVSLTGRHPPVLGRVGGSTKGGALGEGLRSMTVLDTLIDPVEQGAITPN